MRGNEVFELVARVAAILDRLDIPYLVGGSVASAFFGEPRGTLDVDLVIELRAEGIEALATALEPGFYVSREAMSEAVNDRRSFNAVELGGAMKVDFFVRGESDFDREEFSRRRLEPIVLGEPARVWVKTPEDSVLRKLLWFRDGQGASDQQWRDVVGLLATRAGKLDEGHLDSWATRLGLAELLQKARGEAAR